MAALFLNAAGRAAPWLLALGLGALGLVALAGGAPAPFPAPGFLVDAVPARLLGAGTVVAAVAIIVPAVSRTALCAVALVFVVSALLFYGPALAIERADPRLWVALAEALCVAAGLALAAVGSRDGSRTLSAGARVVIGLSLVCFGIVHLVFPDAIAGLMPGWFPGRTLWPYLTGVIQILAGGCLITGWNRRWAAAGVAAMFLCWVPLIHVPRVFGTPADPAEWAFLGFAILLAGAVAASARDTSNQTAPSRASRASAAPKSNETTAPGNLLSRSDHCVVFGSVRQDL